MGLSANNQSHTQMTYRKLQQTKTLLWQALFTKRTNTLHLLCCTRIELINSTYIYCSGCFFECSYHCCYSFFFSLTLFCFCFCFPVLYSIWISTLKIEISLCRLLCFLLLSKFDFKKNSPSKRFHIIYKYVTILLVIPTLL